MIDGWRCGQVVDSPCERPAWNHFPAHQPEPRHLTFSHTDQAEQVSAGIEFVRLVLVDWHLGTELLGDEDWAIDLLLIASELLSNAQKHAGGARTLELSQHGKRPRVAVADDSARPPDLRRPHRPDQPGGHGLHIIVRLSCAWGWEAHGNGKRVWAERALPSLLARGASQPAS